MFGATTCNKRLEQSREMEQAMPVGSQFNYLGRECVVKSLYRVWPCPFAYPIIELLLEYEYADEGGIIRQGSIPYDVALRAAEDGPSSVNGNTRRLANRRAMLRRIQRITGG